MGGAAKFAGTTGLSMVPGIVPWKVKVHRGVVLLGHQVSIE